MIFLTLLLDFINDHPSLVTWYTICSTLFFIMITVVIPVVLGTLGEISVTKTESIMPAITKVGIAFVFLMVFFISKIYIYHKLVPTLTSYMKRRLFRMYLEKHEVAFKEADVSRHITQLLDIVEQIRSLFIWILDTLLPICMLTIFVNAYLGYVIPVIGILHFGINLILFKYIEHAGRRIFTILKEQQAHFLQLIDKIDEKFSNLMNIYLHNKIDASIGEYDQIDHVFTEKSKENNSLIQSHIFTARMITNGFAFFAIAYMYYLVRIEELSVSQFITLSAILYLYCQNTDLVFDRTLITSKEINSIHYNSQLFVMSEQSITDTKPVTDGEIVISGLGFSYKEIPVLRNLSFQLKPGEKVVIVGQTGCGKSTLVKILLGFYPIQSGTIHIDGHDFSSLHVRDVRTAIHYINQQTILFHDTILENIKYGNDASDEDVISLLDKYELRVVFGDDIHKMVETHGSNISAGMQKVILMTRGILRSCKVLIMDEPFTSVDTATRNKILQMIIHETKGKSLLIITHDMNGLETVMDRCVSMVELQDKEVTP